MAGEENYFEEGRTKKRSESTGKEKESRKKFRNSFIFCGTSRNRTRDTRIFSPVLYQLS